MNVDKDPSRQSVPTRASNRGVGNSALPLQSQYQVGKDTELEDELQRGESSRESKSDIKDETNEKMESHIIAKEKSLVPVDKKNAKKNERSEFQVREVETKREQKLTIAKEKVNKKR
jgi:hypothetical protein